MEIDYLLSGLNTNCALYKLRAICKYRADCYMYTYGWNKRSRKTRFPRDCQAQSGDASRRARNRQYLPKKSSAKGGFQARIGSGPGVQFNARGAVFDEPGMPVKNARNMGVNCRFSSQKRPVWASYRAMGGQGVRESRRHGPLVTTRSPVANCPERCDPNGDNNA